MSHSTDDYGDGASERIPEGVPLPRQAPAHSTDDEPGVDWATDSTASDWSAVQQNGSAAAAEPAAEASPQPGTATGEQPAYAPPAWEQPVYQEPSYDTVSPPAWTPNAPQYTQPPAYAEPYAAEVQPQQYAADAQQYAPEQYVPETQQSSPPQPSAPQGQPLQGPPPNQPPNQPQAQMQAQRQPQAPGPQHYAPGYSQPLQPPVPAAPPKPEDLLVPNRSPVVTQPASWGWRGRVHRATGGLAKPKAGPQELLARQAIHDIQRSFSRPMTVVVVQPKGGAGKTPTTICLSAAFGANRGGYVVGWDDNETRGTLAVRVTNPDDQRATVWDLLSDLAAFERFDARVGDLSHYVRSQPDAHFDALVSDDNPGNMSQIGEDEYQRLHKVLQRFYRMIVVDTGNNVRSPNWQAAVNSADLVVVVSSYQRDVGYSGSWVLDHLAQTGREELARNAVTVLTAADPTTDKAVRAQLMEHFQARTRAVIEIPYDTELAHGGPIRWNDLAAPTRNAWVLAGATIANCLAEHDQRAMAARRA